eukprot:c55863_g1_i1 orf=233-562(+)
MKSERENRKLGSREEGGGGRNQGKKEKKRSRQPTEKPCEQKNQGEIKTEGRKKTTCCQSKSRKKREYNGRRCLSQANSPDREGLRGKGNPPLEVAVSTSKLEHRAERQP